MSNGGFDDIHQKLLTALEARGIALRRHGRAHPARRRLGLADRAARAHRRRPSTPAAIRDRAGDRGGGPARHRRRRRLSIGDGVHRSAVGSAPAASRRGCTQIAVGGLDGGAAPGRAASKCRSATTGRTARISRDVAAFARCSIDEVIALHLALEYRVFVVGFVPGLRLHGAGRSAHRRAAPHVAAPEGAGGIGGGGGGADRRLSGRDAGRMEPDRPLPDQAVRSGSRGAVPVPPGRPRAVSRASAKPTTVRPPVG